MKTTLLTFTLVTLTLLFAGCSSSKPRRIVAGGTEAVTTMGADIQDIKHAASQTVEAMLASPAIAKATANGATPTVSLGSIINDSSLNFDIEQVSGRIQEDLLNSGLVEILALDAAAIRENAQDARDGLTNAKADARADFYLEGKIMEVEASDDDVREKTYTFMLRLNNRERRTVFQKTVDIAKQKELGGFLGL